MLIAPLLLSTLLTAPPADACVALVHEADTLAEAEAQETILEHTASGSAVEYRVTWTGDAADFGWVIVIPEGFTGIDDGDADRFDSLRDLTQPEVWTYSTDPGSEESGCGCAGAAKDGAALGGGDRSNGGIDIIAEGFSGSWAYTVISADDSTALGTWLQDNGWDLGDTGSTLDAYIEEGGYELVLVEVAPTVAGTGGGVGTLPPIRIETSSDRLFFPARMARTAVAAELHSIVYTVGDERGRVTGWASEDLEWLEATGDETATEAWENALRELSATAPTYARVAAGEIDGDFVTRFESLAPGAMHTVDAEFVLDDGTDSLQTVVEVWGAALLPLGLIGLAAIRRRGPQR